jgi:hypothetical protein
MQFWGFFIFHAVMLHRQEQVLKPGGRALRVH